MTVAQPLNLENVRERLDAFDFGRLFVEELGWSRPTAAAPSMVSDDAMGYTIRMIAQLGGVAVLEVQTADGGIPDAKTKARIHREVAKLHHENLLIFVDAARARSEWYWMKRENGREIPRPHEYVRGQPGDLFFGKVAPLLFEISDFEKGDPAVVEVARRLRLGLDVEKVTKKFYGEFYDQHIAFLDLISGIADDRQKRWYASVLLNRLMFIWFLQRKGFLGGDLDYLDHKLTESQRRGKDRFFGEFLKLLFFEGFAKPSEERSVIARELLGAIRYLNGGLFLPHAIEEENAGIDVPDRAFANLFKLFRSYSWNLNDTLGGDANEINPDVLGYIFEKYINQKAFGAYYTRTEMTTYLCERTIHRLILDAVNSPTDDVVSHLPGRNYSFKTIGDLKNGLDAPLCRKLLFDVLPKLSILDPACGSGAFLVAAMKTLIDIYGSVIGQAKVRFAADAGLSAHITKIEREHTNIGYYIKKAIITDNLYGVDIMEEAVEIAKLRLFLALVASARTADQLEPLPNIDFNLLPGNSLIGLMRVDEKKFETGDLFRKSYRQVVDDKNRQVRTYRDATTYHDDLRQLRDKIDGMRVEAASSLDKILLEQFGELGIKYEEATWDHGKQREGKDKKRGLTIEDMRDLQPFHWGYEFDEIVNRRGGFDAIITNPPWDLFKPNGKEFFEQYSDVVTKKAMTLHDFETEQTKLLQDSGIRDSWLRYQSRFPHQNAFFRNAADFKNQISIVNEKRADTDINLYKLFLERCYRLLRDGGDCGLVIPSGIYTDLGAKGLRDLLFSSTEVTGLFGFENRKEIFEGVHRSFKFVVLTFRKGGSTVVFPAAFMRRDVEELTWFPAVGALPVSVELVKRLSPDSLSLSEFRTPLDVVIAEKMIRVPLLGRDLPGVWRVELGRELHTTDDGHLFNKVRRRGMLPLYEGKMIHQFDAFYSPPRFFVPEDGGREIAARGERDDSGKLKYERYRLAFRKVARNTDVRTMIATVLPRCVFASDALTLCSSVSECEMLYLAAVLNSFAFDWFLRFKVTANVNYFYVYQTPVPRLTNGAAPFDQLVTRAAKLICTGPEFDDLARKAGIDPTEAAHDPVMRSRIRAEIDAIVAHLFDITEDELQHILTTFPIVPAATKDEVLQVYRSWKPPSDDPLLKLIAGGESLSVEFKSSARWDYKRGQVNKELELIIVKTLAAFMNSDGGTLLIGVSDDGTILGLDPDFATIGKKSADAYENWLMTRLLESIGRDRARLIRVTFQTVEGKQVCRVDVGRSRRPVFVSDDFYVRAGNSTRELRGSDTLQYSREHFDAADRKDEDPAASPESQPEIGGVATRQGQLVKPAAIQTSATPNLAAHGLFRKKKAAEPETPHADADDVGVDDILPLIRDVVAGAESVDREQAIRDIAVRLGVDRVNPRIRASIEAAFTTASRRYIIYSDSGGIRAYCRTIDDYKRDDLKNVLRSVVGRTWTDEEDAVRAGARYLGFRRTGSQIERAFRSAINGGLRQGVLERDGRSIRSV